MKSNLMFISAMILFMATYSSADDVIEARFRSLGAKVAQALQELRLDPPPGLVVPLPAAFGGWVRIVILRDVVDCELRVGHRQERSRDGYRDLDDPQAFCNRHGRRVSALSFRSAGGGVIVLSSYSADIFREGTDISSMVEIILHGVMRLMRFEQRAPLVSGPLLRPVLTLLEEP